MLIKGFQKTTLLDFPEKVACTVFTGGCNFRCPFCHNASLVTHIDTNSVIEENEVFDYIKRRRGILDGVCITGGEPMLQKDISDFCQKIHDLGLLVKLDTNGSFPERLKALIDKRLIDYVAMDIKNSPTEYSRTCGIDTLPAGVEKSIDLLMNSNIDYEFRTTVVRELHTKKSMEELAMRISGAKRYFLQTFTDSGDLIENGYSAYDEKEMGELLNIVKMYVPNAKLRGI